MGGRVKLERFAQMKTFPNVFEADTDKIKIEDFQLKGKWGREYFKNDNPITLELGCGKGEYTVGLAEKYPDRNFIGIDIKGARMWKGAKYALENNIGNAAFIRSRIEFVERLFGKDEIEEIWITFPDPFPKKPSNRLSSSYFINRYFKVLSKGGYIHLKTDCRELHDYTLIVLEENGVIPEVASNNLYATDHQYDDILSLKTFYEMMFLKEDKPITYLRFKEGAKEILTESRIHWE